MKDKVFAGSKLSPAKSIIVCIGSFLLVVVTLGVFSASGFVSFSDTASMNLTAQIYHASDEEGEIEITDINEMPVVSYPYIYDPYTDRYYTAYGSGVTNVYNPAYGPGYTTSYSTAYGPGYTVSSGTSPWMGASGWVTLANNQYMYYYANGTYAHDNFDQINGVWYYFDSNGLMHRGWLYVNGAWYYMLPTGAMAASGWNNINEKWYYFNESGVMRTGYIILDGKVYYADASGARVQMAYNPDGYLFGADGVLIQ